MSHLGATERFSVFVCIHSATITSQWNDRTLRQGREREFTSSFVLASWNQILGFMEHLTGLSWQHHEWNANLWIVFNFQSSHWFWILSIHFINCDIIHEDISKAIPLQAWTDPEGSRRMRLPDFKTISKWRW